ncbi:MAG: hypothetical protein R3F59_30265 [Myxococcota bacterium]
MRAPPVFAAPVVAERAPAVDVTAGLLVATAYANRGLNQFGADQTSLAGLVGPSLELGKGPFTLGWFGAFQATGANRDVVVREGLGHEQNVYATVAGALRDDLVLEGGLLATSYPFASAEAVGVATPLFLEPSVALTLERAVSVSLGLAHAQAVQPGLGGSFTYLSGGLSYATPIHRAAEVVLGATGGAKRWVVGPQGGANSFDADLSWGLHIVADRLDLTPAGHLTWTNLPDRSAGAETFAWFGVETTLGLLESP